MEIDLDKKFNNAYEHASYLNEKILNIDLKKYRWDRCLFNWVSAHIFHLSFQE